MARTWIWAALHNHMRVAGTSLRFRPGVLTGGSDLAHDCGTERSVIYFAEALVFMGMYSKKVRHMVACNACAAEHSAGLQIMLQP